VEEQIGQVPMVYTSPGYMLPFEGGKASFLGRYPLVVVHYIELGNLGMTHPWADRGWFLAVQR